MKKAETRILISSGLLSVAALVGSFFLESAGLDVDLTPLNDGVLTLAEAVQIGASLLGAGVLARFGVGYKIVKAEKIEVYEDIDSDL